MRRLAGLDQALDGELRSAACRGAGASMTRQVRDRPDQEPHCDRRPGGRWPTGRRESGSRSASAANRSSETARSAPRFVGARAWTSSTIRCSTPLPVRPPAFLAQEQREALGRGDQDVRRMIAQACAAHGPTCRRCARRPGPGSRRGRRRGGSLPAARCRFRSMS